MFISYIKQTHNKIKTNEKRDKHKHIFVLHIFFEIMDNYLIRYADGTIQNNMKRPCFWHGLFSNVRQNGILVQFLTILMGQIQIEFPDKKFVFFMPQSDGDIRISEYPNVFTDIFLQEMRDSDTILLIGTVAQRFQESGTEYHNIKMEYIFLPQDDELFQDGLLKYFSPEHFPKWEDRICKAFWRGSGSRYLPDFLRKRVVMGLLESTSADVKFIENNIYSEDNIPVDGMSEIINCYDFLNYKMVLIIDGNGISSAHTWCFGIGAVPMMITNNTFWFSDLLVPFGNYIPIRYDLTDLQEKINWVLEHPVEAREIVERATEFAYRVFSPTPGYQSNYLLRRFREILS